uniref:Uncharacterized protein n=1 Tax=Nelumbo nucifera TaxID=4432 RepID=A0A822Y2S3_NELNU|nr:TPA_asm: hypothetical protein HUJ06_027741 [Nelumbo nucifera]
MVVYKGDGLEEKEDGEEVRRNRNDELVAVVVVVMCKDNDGLVVMCKDNDGLVVMVGCFVFGGSPLDMVNYSGGGLKNLGEWAELGGGGCGLGVIAPDARKGVAPPLLPLVPHFNLLQSTCSAALEEHSLEDY